MSMSIFFCDTKYLGLERGEHSFQFNLYYEAAVGEMGNHVSLGELVRLWKYCCEQDLSKMTIGNYHLFNI